MCHLLIVHRRNITHFLIRTACLSGNIRQKEDFIDCWYSNILACLLYATYVGLEHVCMCEEMFVSRMNYDISLFFIYREVSGFHQNSRKQFYFFLEVLNFIFLVGSPINQQSLTVNKIW